MHGALLFLLLPAAAPMEIQLEPQQKKLVRLDGLARIAVGDPTVADVKVLGDGQVELTGEHEGRTALLVWKAGGERVEVRVTDASRGRPGGRRRPPLD